MNGVIGEDEDHENQPSFKGRVASLVLNSLKFGVINVEENDFVPIDENVEMQKSPDCKCNCN